jgi:hypothetical protein
VAPELADDVQCSSLPPGLTKDDAYVILFRAREGDVNPSGPILQPEDRSPEDEGCTEHDRAVGLDFSSVRFDDMTSVQKLQTWKAP